jgi:hypothetical protein
MIDDNTNPTPPAKRTRRTKAEMDLAKNIALVTEAANGPSTTGENWVHAFTTITEAPFDNLLPVERLSDRDAMNHALDNSPHRRHFAEVCPTYNADTTISRVEIRAKQGSSFMLTSGEHAWATFEGAMAAFPAWVAGLTMQTTIDI